MSLFSEPPSPALSETSESAADPSNREPGTGLSLHDVLRVPYERKVGFLTRPQATLVEAVMTKLATDPNAFAAIGLEFPRGREMAKRVANLVHVKIEKRDEAMRAKGYGTEANPDPDVDSEDQPFEELEEPKAKTGFIF